MNRVASFFLLTLCALLGKAQGTIPQIVSFEPSNGFCLTTQKQTAMLCVDDNDFAGVRRAVADLATDVERVSGRKPAIAKRGGQGTVIIGTLGHSALVDRLAKKGQLDVTRVKGQWESFVIQTIGKQLVVAGSDRRGTIYGIYELSRQMGVSPWYWWADVPVEHHNNIYVREGCFVQPSPQVRYRGIFINDEDWGLKPWSSTNYEPELGDIGPRTYARVCELLLRLKANMLAPAMHSCTGAFYAHPESKVVCDSFSIVITTSHCEPLLLNNAAKSEWDSQRDGEWNYKTNRDVIYKKWDDRLSEAARFENIYTVAMRGVHDEGLRGSLPMEERVPLIEQVIDDQRQLLRKHKAYTPQNYSLSTTPSPLSTIHSPLAAPQIFVPYKETMDIYEAGLKVPDDITLVWVDDNYGYMKRVASPEEQQRSGRSGVYYHLSYLGAPHDYLWLNTTPPALMYEELKKAYDNGADRYWLLNVGDIKPMELGLQTFADLAWDPTAFNYERINTHQAAFLARSFHGSASSDIVATYQSILDEYYRLAWSRKPEFMGFEYQWDDKEHTGLKSTDYSFQHYDDARQRLADYQRISDEVERLAVSSIPADAASRASFFELLQFPVQGAYQMNRKFLMAQLNRELAAEGRHAEANWAARQMEAAYDSINALNRRYNQQLGGKWNGMMALSTSFTPTCQYYQKPEVTYFEGAGEQVPDLSPRHETLTGCFVPRLDHYAEKQGDVRLVQGLGYDWQAVQLMGGSITYALPAMPADSIEVTIYTLPFWPLYKGLSNRVLISVDGSTPQVFENPFKEYSRTWKDQVMRNGAYQRLRFAINRHASAHTLTIATGDTGQMVQRIIADWGGLQPTYVGPPAPREN